MACLPRVWELEFGGCESPYSFTGAIERNRASFEVGYRQREDGIATKHGVHGDEALCAAIGRQRESPIDHIELRRRAPRLFEAEKRFRQHARARKNPLRQLSY